MSNKNKRLPIGKEELARAMEILKGYKKSKAELDRRIIQNEQWYNLRYSDLQGEQDKNSAWLFNSIINKHADAMDSYPEPNVLPRERSDEEKAKAFSSLLPAVLEQRSFEQVYSDAWWYKLKTGTAVYGVFWNKQLENGLGDIDICSLNMLNLFWEPGIKYIEQSPNVFYLTVTDRALLLDEYPELAATISDPLRPEEYSPLGGAFKDKVTVVDWYYKRYKNGKKLLHYCKFVGDTLLFSSENLQQYGEVGFYAHGRYPFVFDPLFVKEDSPAGFGYIDVMKGCQLSIDRLDSAIERNALMSETPRWFISDGAGINEEEYADWSRPFIHTAGHIDDRSLKQLQVERVSENALKLLQFKVDELKETSGNRDFAQGSTNFGVTAASAIIALQEAGNKLARDMVKSSFRAYKDICYLVLELIRQFYTEPRTFRIIGEGGKADYICYGMPDIEGRNNFAGNHSVFDIRIVPQKQNPYQKSQQNELAKELFELGFLAPERRQEALLAVKLMDFDGKAELLSRLAEGMGNGDCDGLAAGDEI